MAGATGRIANTPLPQIAKHVVGMLWSSPPQPLQPLGIAMVDMSSAAAVAIFAAISEAQTTCTTGPAINAKARNKADKRRTINDIALRLAPAPAESQRTTIPTAERKPK